MLKIRDLGINLIPETMRPLGMPPAADKAYGYLLDAYISDTCPPTEITCPDLSCFEKPKSRKKPKKKPAKKTPAKKTPKKKPAKRGYRAGGFGFAAIAQLERQLEEQLRNER